MSTWIFNRGNWEETNREDLTSLAVKLDTDDANLLAEHGYRKFSMLGENDILGDTDLANYLQIFLPLSTEKAEFYSYMEMCIGDYIDSIYVKDFPSFVQLTKSLTQLLHNLSRGTYDEYEALRNFKQYQPSAATTIQVS